MSFVIIGMSLIFLLFCYYWNEPDFLIVLLLLEWTWFSYCFVTIGMNLIFLLLCYYWTERMKHEYEVTYWTSLFRVLRRQGIIIIINIIIIFMIFYMIFNCSLTYFKLILNPF